MAGSFVLSFEVAGDTQIRRGFSRFTDGVKDLREPFEEIAKDFAQIETKQFDTQGSYGSGGWKDLSPRYEKRKKGGSILVKTGLLRGSLLGGNPWSIRVINPLELRLGTKLHYGIYHQTGTRKMPARPPIQLTDADKSRWTKFIHKYLVKKIDEEFSSQGR